MHSQIYKIQDTTFQFQRSRNHLGLGSHNNTALGLICTWSGHFAQHKWSGIPRSVFIRSCLRWGIGSLNLHTNNQLPSRSHKKCTRSNLGNKLIQPWRGTQLSQGVSLSTLAILGWSLFHISKSLMIRKEWQRWWWWWWWWCWWWRQGDCRRLRCPR